MNLGEKCQHLAFIFQPCVSFGRQANGGFKLPDRSDIVAGQRKGQPAACRGVDRDIGDAAARRYLVDTQAVKVGQCLILREPSQFHAGEMRNELDGRIRVILLA